MKTQEEIEKEISELNAEIKKVKTVWAIVLTMGTLMLVIGTIGWLVNIPSVSVSIETDDAYGFVAITGGMIDIFGSTICSLVIYG